MLLPGYDPWRDAGDCVYDSAAGDRACAFFSECLTHIEGELSGKPFVLQPWQRGIVKNLFGWKRPDGTRRYREAFVFVPRKNGKSPTAAGILNYMLFCDGEPGAQIVGAAGSVEQAALLFRHAVGMVRNEKELDDRATIYDGYRQIVLKSDRASAYKVLSADADTKHGGNLHFGVIDELHVQRTRDLLDTLRTSCANRRQPLLLYITTAGWDRHSICYEVYEYACKVRDGVIQESAFLPAIWEAPDGSDWKEESTWRIANPNLGVSVSLDYLRRECKRAIETPAYQNTFKRLHLNIWTETDERWLSLDTWDKCGEPFDVDELAGAKCWGGLDLSTSIDLTAFALVFPWKDGFRVLVRTWVPMARARQKEDRDRVPYSQWGADGHCILHRGETIDYGDVIDRIVSDSQRFAIQDIGFDPYNCAHVAETLSKTHGIEMVAYRQGFLSMNEPCKRLEALLLQGKLWHGGNPVLRWAASNAAAETDAAGNTKPSKAMSTQRIDPLVAVIMGLGRALVQSVDGGSVYDSRDVVVL